MPTPLAERRPLILIGASVRAAAASALRAGWLPWCVDLFADVDLRSIAQAMRCPADRYPTHLPNLLREAPPDAPFAFTGALENHGEILAAIERAHPPLGTPATALPGARSPGMWLTLPPIEGLRVPTRDAPPGGPMLHKPIRGAGGAGIRYAASHEPLPPGYYAQPFIPGRPLAAAYLAPTGDTKPGAATELMGVTEQLIGPAWLGCEGFRYAGSIGPLSLPPRVGEALTELGRVLTQRLGLRGPFGVDAVLDTQGVLWPIELNPRYTAGMEVLERATGRWAFGPREAQTEAQSDGRSDAPIGASARVHAKAYVFATRSLRAGDLLAALGAQRVADIPEPGEPLPIGSPICTVLAAGADGYEALRELRDLAGRVYTACEA